MAKEIKTELLINAPPEKVWSILTDFENYPQWNPFIKSLSGEAKAGNKIKVRIEPPGASGMTFKPKILVMETNREFRWLGHLLFAGLFDGEHRFELIRDGNNTLFKQSERFTGILVPLFANQLDKNTTEGFELMNRKLKEMCEKK